MRIVLLIAILIASAGCRGSVQFRPPSLELRGSTAVRVEARASAPVPLDGSAAVEFFGVPLEGATDVVFVLDRSGSMAEAARGQIAEIKKRTETEMASKLEVAQEELADALAQLPDGIRVNVILFNDGLQAVAPAMTSLEPDVRERVLGFVRASSAYGDTALVPAMRTAFLMNPRRIVLLSDGLGNVGGDSDNLLRDAREAVRGGVRIDTIGIGPAQDSELLQSLASVSGGLYQPL